MKNRYLILIALILLGKLSQAQIVTGSSGEIEIPNVTSNVGPLGGGSLLLFLSGTNTAIQENWGLNLDGDPIRPVKIPFSSLLIGYTSGGGVNYGTGNAYISGMVGIGTTTVPPGYSLAVDGSAIATSFTVQSYANWPDYVFKPDYQLPSLSMIRTYIDQNHHLPEMPSADQVAKDGINLGDMDKLLTKKVEELTLYLIQKDETEKEQQQQIDKQQQEIEQLKHVVQLLIHASDKK